MEDPLKFEFEEHPSWRSPEKKTTSEMLREIAELTDRYETLPEEAHKFSQYWFARAMAVNYIYHSNVGEDVGTQTMDETETLLERLFDKKELQESDKSKEKMETINTCKAMRAIHEIHKEMEKTGMLTVRQVCEVHKVLMDGLHPKCGKIRESEVFASCQNGPHFYPSPQIAEQLFYSVLDRHNIHMASFKSATTTCEMIDHLFKCAAWLLFHFVNTHPFSDGNGRMCRLLANYVLSVITPFPVALYHSHHSNRSGRQNYIDAIVECRNHPEQRPCKLATMLVEGAWWGWTCLFQNLEQRKLLESTYGPIIIQKSKTGEVKDRVAKVFGKEPGVDMQVITEKLIRETMAVEVVDLKPYQCVGRTVQVGETLVIAKIFP